MAPNKFGYLHSEDYYEEFTRSYEVRYVAEIVHLGLHKFRTLKDSSSYILNSKVKLQFDTWDQQYSRKLDKEAKEKSKVSASRLTKEAREIQEGLESILHHTLEIDDAVNWNSLKDFSNFDEQLPPKPEEPTKPIESEYKSKIDPPLKRFYEPKLSILDKLVSSYRKKKVQEAKDKFDLALEKWNSENDDIVYYNSIINRRYQSELDNYQKEVKKWENDVAAFKNRKKEFYKAQDRNNQSIDELKNQFLQRDPNAINEYFEIVLNNSDYSNFNFPKDFELEYLAHSSTLVVEYYLPDIEDIPTLTEIKYIASRDELKEVHLSNTKKLKLYDTIIYQIVIRSLHELFEADVINAVDYITFNGWVTTVDKAKGQKTNCCITSIHVSREEFLKIDLYQVKPKLCFKGLKGIASPKIHNHIAIKPIQNINKTDKRFIDSKDISGNIQEGDNLASMDWEDFEHLIRELFHKEFSSNGGEVKVTQSSRDGGVDAIAFNPDPIMGGKIVIQAKRYTNTVGVSAIRDLWGTTMNEGASKGIIVTTSNYGPEAYNFAKDKPLSLINGSNLLYLMEKHGYNVKIDLKEAKEAAK
ncbi:restriction endonuclease [Salegentibacter salegens]|uniref:Restriction system protein n=1 Tax=Salegentibacter salegens TaxID=143223 RepID=A0A1M7KC61_9FLAO|nr:restriction endonuclease [Salegentibacter salegens]PRX44364.1 restriction system protein [Salegentibacter salegens]SHM62805.1 restriction system protein [Salegentibacter salegens]